MGSAPSNLDLAGANWPAETFGAYTLLECLGVGGMATVHRALHMPTGNEVALKRLLPQFADDVALNQQFLREAHIASLLRHPNIVGVTDFGVVEGTHYLAMERIHGKSVLELLRRANEDQQPAPIGVTLWILHEVLSALDHAMNGLDDEGKPFHIVHRDLSPSNIIITPEGEVKLIDFGIAKSLAGRYATNSGRIKGKLGYMSPEALAGRRVDSRSDLFSLAVLGWELLTARRLFRGSESQQFELRARQHELTPPSHHNPWVPPQLEAVLARALASEPDERFPSAAEMLYALAPIMHEQATEFSSAIVVQWLRLLKAGEGVLDHSKTQIDNRRLEQVTPAPRRVLPAAKHIPGVRRFVDEVATEVDTILDEERARPRATASAFEDDSGDLALGSQERLLPSDSETSPLIVPHFVEADELGYPMPTEQLASLDVEFDTDSGD